jgi:hypothetical protein
MNLPVTTFVSFAIASLAIGLAAEAPQAGGGGLDEMIEKLSSESFQEREKATRELWQAGDDAIESLRRASASDDPETAIRAAGVLEKVELRITPETPAAILDKIQRFRSAPPNLKANFLNELKSKKAYFQLLKLFSMEKNPDEKAEMGKAIRGVAMLGAREAIAADDSETAIELLLMSAKEPNDLMALACIYRSMGKLGEGMEDPPIPADVATEEWKITLLRAKGDIEGAAKLAAESKQTRLLAGLRVLTGDPTLWMRQNGLGDRRNRALDGYVDVALKRWEGEKVVDADFAPLLAILKSRDSDDQIQAISSLAALGRLSEVEKQLAEDQPDAAFAYYLAQERIDEALETIGLDPAKPDYAGWVSKRFAQLLADDDDDEDGDDSGSPETELLMLAGFLESRGMGGVLDAAYSAKLEAYAKADREMFMDFMGSLFETGYAPMFAMERGAAWAGDDEGRWDELLSVVFGEEKEVGEWLGWIEKIEPGVSNADKMSGMMALFGIGADPEHLGEKWLEKAWKAVEKSPEDEKAAHIQRIRALAVARQDVVTALKARDMLDEESQASAMWTSIDRYLSAANRWKDAAEILESSKNGVSTSPELHAYLAATLRRAGLGERAAVHDRWAEKLSLGYAPTCSRIGDHYMYGGDPERADKWYHQAACQADVSGSEFPAVLDTYARSMLEEGRWDIAASCYEALVQAYASQQFAGGMLQTYAKARLNADLAKALAVLPEDRERAIALLEGIHRNFVTDGILADDFFPLLRKAGLTAELKQWFGESWEKISAVIKRFPDSDNTRNTAAWLASRAGMQLGDAEKHLKAALDRNPGQAAYLDTMAEVRFAQGDRAGAVKWSDRSLMFYPLTDSPYDVMIRKQNWRFKNAPLPK